MNTPIADFVRGYAASGMRRLHMPGHKGRGPLGCEELDITEVAGADALYEAEGIIAESEQNAAALFGSGSTFYSTEGSSHCIRAMLYLAVTCRRKGSAPLVVAARNVHKSFIYAAALAGFDIEWLWPEGERRSICACPVTAEALARTLDALDAPPAAVYITSPDYLGGRQDIAALARVCHERGTLLAVDNAHGAYLHFCNPPQHPLDLGADICCDSAHKTLPVLTGGAYLHIARHAPAELAANARAALALFGSTSPSYLMLCSLDLCNAQLAGGYPAQIAQTAAHLDELCERMRAAGWALTHDEPLKVTLHASACGMSGIELAQRLREGGVECEYADRDDLVLMAAPMNDAPDFELVCAAAGSPGSRVQARMPLPAGRPLRRMSVREALFAPHETIPVRDAAGRICAAPLVSCPPAIPIAVSGEKITAETIALFECYGVERVDVIRTGTA